METHYDVLIVGAGLFGATCAYELTKKGFTCLVLERRRHIGGNCYTEERDGINTHVYGPHIFHTSRKTLWDWISQFATFNHYRHRVRVKFENGIYSFPPNLSTFNQLWGVTTPQEARQYLDHAKQKDRHLDSVEDWALAQLGTELYDACIRGYTKKQWNRDPSKLPASIIKRIPIRFTYDDNYFDDPFQGIPIGGYTGIFAKLLSNVDIRTNTDYFENRSYFDALARRTLYTGPIDKFYHYRFGRLEYRSLRFEHERLEMPDFQGIAQMNYASERVPYTRIVEHKHFEFGQQPVTWITREFPASSSDENEEMYPVRDDANLRILEKYRLLCEQREHRKHYFGGRLADFQYYDMHQAIAAALKMVPDIEIDLIQSTREAFSNS